MGTTAKTEVKNYVPDEERLNVWTHAAGGLAALAGTAMLAAKCAGTPRLLFASIVYGISLFCMFAGSTAYHAAHGEFRAKLRVFDHSAIYLLIAGTYTPLILGVLPDGWSGRAVLAAVWGIGAAGIVCEIAHCKPFRGFSVVLYLAAGWLCMMVLPQLTAGMSRDAFALLLGGGIAYTAGVPFYLTRKNYSHAVWHFFVLAGAVLHFGSIWLIVGAAS